jgi:hypothetical protein
MNSAAFLVDGHQEKKFVQQVCPGKPVRMLNLNGNSVTSAAIAKRIATHCRLFGGKYHPIVIWVDREDRDTSAPDLVAELDAAIRAAGVLDDIILGVADRAIENWILADRETVRPLCRDTISYPRQPDGFNGKSRMKKLFTGYHETTTGVELLTKCYASRMMTSASFRAFFECFPDNNCWWLAR